jgi:hypothetical protein
MTTIIRPLEKKYLANGKLNENSYIIYIVNPSLFVEGGIIAEVIMCLSRIYFNLVQE